MAAPSVKAFVTLKSGEKHSFRQDVKKTDDKDHYPKLRESLKKIQEEVNVCLTQQVELEKASNQAGGDSKAKLTKHAKKEDQDQDDGESDQDEDDMDKQKDSCTSKRTKDSCDEGQSAKKQKT